MTREAFLNNTILYYNSTNRAIRRNDSCTYLPTENSEGCAIGRFIPDAALKKQMDNIGSICQVESYINVWQNLPEWMQQMDLDFLSEVQDLHDSSYSWNSEGLSKLGMRRVRSIIAEYELNEDLVLENVKIS